MGTIHYTKEEMLGLFQEIETEVRTYLEDYHVEGITPREEYDYDLIFTPTGEMIYSRLCEFEDDINFADNDTILAVDEDKIRAWRQDGYEPDVPWEFITKQ